MLSVGQSIGNYVIRSRLGEGGMGVVFLAEHPLIGRRVAIKVLHPEMARSPDLVSRFFTEAQSVNRIGHANIVDITDFGQTPTGESYFVMEYLPGESLGARLKRGRLEILDALYIAQQVADALAASHRAGILHRDLKPDNIFLVPRANDAQFVKVLDFGLAKLTSRHDQVSHRTRTGSVMGTPYYMAPEQCAGKGDIDARADVYALGVILFEMLTGKVPFTGEGYGEIIVKHMTVPPPRVRELRPDVPAWLDELVGRTLAKERKDRVQSMEELRGTMISCLDGGVLPQPRKPSSSPSLLVGSRPARRRTGLILGGAAAVVLGATAAIVLARDQPAVAVAAAPPDAAPAAVVVAPPPPQPKVEPLPPPPPARIIIHLESDPAGATVALADGTELGKTPVDWTVDPSDTTVEISFKKDGHETRTRQVSLKQASSLVVDLPRARAVRPPRPTPAPAPQPRRPPEDDLMTPPAN